MAIRLKKNRKNMFDTRMAGCLFLIVLLFFVSIVRILQITQSNSAQVARNQSSVRVTITKPRGTIFDAKLHPLVNQTTRYVAAVSPTPAAIIALKNALPESQLETALSRLEKNRPVAVPVPYPISADGITMFSVQDRYAEDQSASHIIGYLDSTGHGVSGIEKAFDGILYKEDSLDVIYTIDATGKILPGIEPEIEGDAGTAGEGVALTIDADIQAVAEKASDSITSGAVVVMEVGTGKLRAVVSRPNFYAANLADSINAANSPMINRALASYNVGSVFKPCVAAAALEKGILPASTYTCTGSADISGRVFRCHKEDGHGTLNLSQALVVSCNTYFYDLAARTGADRILAMAKAFGFGQSRRLADGLVSDAGSLPNPVILSQQPATLANFAIGQGELMLSPVALASLYEAVAGDGTYHAPTLIEGEVSGGVVSRPEEVSPPTRVMKASTAKFLREALIQVVNGGTGSSAMPASGGAGGKTATAQTGWIQEGSKVVQGWFGGFYPAESPKYVIIVLVENAVSGGQSCGPIFKSIADGIAALEQN